LNIKKTLKSQVYLALQLFWILKTKSECLKLDRSRKAMIYLLLVKRAMKC
jgi:hypothetical protein